MQCPPRIRSGDVGFTSSPLPVTGARASARARAPAREHLTKADWPIICRTRVQTPPKDPFGCTPTSSSEGGGQGPPSSVPAATAPTQCNGQGSVGSLMLGMALSEGPVNRVLVRNGPLGGPMDRVLVETILSSPVKSDGTPSQGAPDSGFAIILIGAGSGFWLGRDGPDRPLEKRDQRSRQGASRMRGRPEDDLRQYIKSRCNTTKALDSISRAHAPASACARPRP